MAMSVSSETTFFSMKLQPAISEDPLDVSFCHMTICQVHLYVSPMTHLSANQNMIPP